jgi:AcrR family transcriptional regulator
MYYTDLFTSDKVPNYHRAMTDAAPADKARERILRRAGELFYSEGIGAVGVDRISETAPVSKRTLYQRFASKDDLVAEYLATTGVELLDTLLKPADAVASPVEKILAVFTAEQDQSVTSGFRGCPFVNAAVELTDPHHPGRTIAMRNKLRLQEFFARQAALAGATAPDELAEQLVMLFDGGMAYALVRNTGIPSSILAAARSLIDAQT